MDLAIVLLVTAPALALISVVLCISRSSANLLADRLRRTVTLITLLQFVLALSALGALVFERLFGGGETTLYRSETFFGLSILLDGVSCLMFAMVSYVGWVICRYSIRYLDGDSAQGNHFRWVAFTLGAVSLMVISGNLLMFFAAWLATSWGLHHLLLHFPNRSGAQRAAWTKFTISRIGDGALAFAILLIYTEFGTLSWSELFTAVAAMGEASANVQAAACLLVAAAAIKSAQFPVHTWLPQTLETPTPVSALMHAGIVNAGGYLIIRASPIAATTSWALSILAIVGAVTAIYAATVMLTQTSVKKSLAYSTIAQMGFMMLQCGLGAFSAAMLHIIAHSMYKAHAFLGSGNVLVDLRSANAPTTSATDNEADRLSWPAMAMATAGTLGLIAVAMALFGINPIAKPGGLLLGAILALALSRWICSVLRTGDAVLVRRSFLVSALLALAYVTLYRITDFYVAGSVPTWTMPTAQWIVLALVIGFGFTGMLLVERLARSQQTSGRLAAWYVHASNGFYLESTLRRVFGSLAST